MSFIYNTISYVFAIYEWLYYSQVQNAETIALH